jgi:Ca2+-binding RTX toxin-like protein
VASLGHDVGHVGTRSKKQADERAPQPVRCKPLDRFATVLDPSLICPKGKDTLKGGGGRDLCKGGKGNDTASKCEVEKSI